MSFKRLNRIVIGEYLKIIIKMMIAKLITGDFLNYGVKNEKLSLLKSPPTNEQLTNYLINYCSSSQLESRVMT